MKFARCVLMDVMIWFDLFFVLDFFFFFFFFISIPRIISTGAIFCGACSLMTSRINDQSTHSTLCMNATILCHYEVHRSL